MQKVYKDIGRVAPQDVNVLILGESGTGKELVARAIYHHSARSKAPFLAINCAAIPDALLESELFGHERGAFTGADRKRIGKFEQADRGTLFLDEIGDMSLATQAKILRLLQDGCFQRVGGNETIRTDVRLIAATNKELDQAIKNREFREDIYYRLKVFSIHLPPLRERMEDLPLLVEHFTKSDSSELGGRAVTVPPETMHILQCYDWPGNVRELQGVLKYALVKACGKIITPDCLPESLSRAPSAAGGTRVSFLMSHDLTEQVRRRIQRSESNLYHQMHEELDRVLLDEALRAASGNQVLASRLLGISRTTLRAKLGALSDPIHDYSPSDAE
jgi:two-component system nitrogen regulation response regulator GlnG